MSGLRRTTVLALHGLHLLLRRQKPVTITEIGRSGGFPPGRVRAVLHQLAEAGFVSRRAGRGYVLAKAPGEISLADVIRTVEKSQPPASPCSGDYDACDSRASCILAPLCRKAQEAFQASLREFTLADLAETPVDLPNCLDPRIRPRAS